MTDNINTNKIQHNDAIENDPKFDNIFSLYSGTKEPLTVVIFSLKWYKKQTPFSDAGLTCLWDRGDTGNMIKRKHTKHYKCRICSNKVE